MREKAALGLSTGCEEFWVVDTNRKIVTVTRRGGESHVYRVGDSVPLTAIDGGIAVNEIFL
jgi:Uma2 family endonuclease